MIVAAIPIAIAAKKNKKKAKLYMNREQVMITPLVTKGAQLTSVGIEISL